MDWKDLGKKIAEMGAPLLGAALGGAPGAAAAGALVAKLFGTKQDPEAIWKEIQKDSEAALKLRQLEMGHEETLLKLHLEDVASARQREIEVVKATGEKDKFLYFLAMLVVFGFFALCALLMYRKIPEGASQAVYMLFGGLVSGFMAVLQYFFGSSKSSKDKTSLLAKK